MYRKEIILLEKTITHKVCIKCKLKKELEKFGIQSGMTDGRRGECKKCKNKMRREGGKPPLIIILFEKIIIAKKCCVCKTKKLLTLFIKKQHNITEFSNTCRECHNTRVRVSSAKKRKKNKKVKKPLLTKEEKKENRRIYIKANKVKIQTQANTYQREKRKNNPAFNLRNIVGCALRGALNRKGYTKKSRLHEIIGCSFDFFVDYIEKQFEPWMNWKNHGLYNGTFKFGWDLDHFTCLASAGKDEKKILELFHYTNLKPLCSYINRDIKKDRLDFKMEEILILF